MVRGQDGSGLMIFSKEGVTQGCPLAMVAYGVGVLPLIRNLKERFPKLYQSWYADDASAAGTLKLIKEFFEELVQVGPKYGYFPEPSKSILVVSSNNQPLALNFVETNNLGFIVKTGARYLGGFVGEETDRNNWLEEKISEWSFGVGELANLAHTHPQSAFAGLQKSLQNEWGYVQRVVEGASNLFQPLEEKLATAFLPALFGEHSIEDTHRRLLAALPVKFAGLAIPNPVATADSNYKTSTLVCGHLVQAVNPNNDVKFSQVDHISTRKTVMAEVRDRKTKENEASLTAALSSVDADTRRTILRAKHCGQWLSAMPSTVNGTELSSQEFRDNLLIRYGRTPGDLPTQCDGCKAKFTLQHALECKKGGLIHMRHNEIVGELMEWTAKAMSNSAVRVEPLIKMDSNADTDKAELPTTCDNNPPEMIPAKDGLRGDILVRGLFQRGLESIVDVRVTDTDAASYRNRDPAKILANQEKEKKSKYLQSCLDQRRSFIPFVVSTDGMLGYEANNLIKCIAQKLADKWKLPYSVICGLLRSRMSIAIARATHLCIRGSRVTATRISRKPQWEDGAGVPLYESDY
jgi:hypothetical protein